MAAAVPGLFTIIGTGKDAFSLMFLSNKTDIFVQCLLVFPSISKQ